MLTFLKAAARIIQYRTMEWMTKKANTHAVNAWASALDREDRVREILGAERFESTEEAAWRVTGESQS